MSNHEHGSETGTGVDLKVLVTRHDDVGPPIATRALEIGHHVDDSEPDADRTKRLLSGSSSVDDASEGTLGAALDRTRYVRSERHMPENEVRRVIIDLNRPGKAAKGSRILILELPYNTRSAEVPASRAPVRYEWPVGLGQGCERLTPIWILSGHQQEYR